MKARMVQHGLIGLILVMTGIESLDNAGGAHMLLSVLDILVGAAVAASVIREFRRSHTEKHSSVPWVDVFAASMLAIEGAHKLAEGNKHITIATCYFLLAVATVFIGIRLHHGFGLRRIVLDDKRIFVRMSPFRSFAVNWDALDSVRISPAGLELVSEQDRRNTIDFSELTNGREVHDALYRYFQDNQLLRKTGDSRP